MNKGISSNLGYPRIGENREWKKGLEAFWAGTIEKKEFLAQMQQSRLQHLQKQKEIGIDLIPVNDFTMYDHMLDMAVMFGYVPKRYEYAGGVVPLSIYFAMARGNQHAVACEMTKWFNTNYHYIVPEFQDIKPVLTENKPLLAYKEAKEELGIKGKPVIIGPYTFIKLSKGFDRIQIPAIILQLVPLYVQVLTELAQEGVEWIQMDEPILVTSLSEDEMKTISYIYEQLHEAVPQLQIMLQTYFGSVTFYNEVSKLPVAGIGLDFVHDAGRSLEQITTNGFPQDKVLGAGIIDGRNIWRANLTQKTNLLATIKEHVDASRIWIQPSSSLLHVPISLNQETQLDPLVKDSLAFADEKLIEIKHITDWLQNGEESVKKIFTENQTILERVANSVARNRPHIHETVASLQLDQIGRASDYEQRRKQQQHQLQLPILPTTTIGSFPQTTEVRQARNKWRKGEWSAEQYEQFLQAEIREWIDIQEKVGLDVLVHGEFERTDMVEFFGEKLGGFAFTKNGWVQSYGSRCVKPPVIYGDVEFIEPMTVKESIYAQSLTTKPVKGMITGPVTILNWSFVRDDISRQQVTYQIALALQKEVEALEASGITMIQVDEPALREGLPLKKTEWEAYLEWAVKAFRLTTSTVKDTTQIHTHMCYCEFHDFIDSISELDADVISIETSRSHGELIHAFHNHSYLKGIGLGVYDIHSPRVPAVEEMIKMIENALQVLEPRQFWINPDCGLKTRGRKETIASLENMVTATRLVRNTITAIP
ncbi:5-methyltetrahydropteroyltriglutamate--homocysteine S-methyltransferase [Brevibacillus laterosporus]|uniref:5-methyltetrahydropteroyltriglutamate-- homocysteine S-methyltransferase n=1 Tax=Brevibacillus laterosporus TaxID=1465 RepID=UPI000BC82A4D|nr:5-methyltetrahydropteroyltriglutamate--homocysteine S-methyltransferase [Brevibacillus laterosporus]PCN46235.1 5-methyltetrahydropteroyltriglutamate--homocysteine S-methyltransferase [Brevibacillus laterosporus]